MFKLLDKKIKTILRSLFVYFDLIFFEIPKIKFRGHFTNNRQSNHDIFQLFEMSKIDSIAIITGVWHMLTVKR